MKAYLLTSRMLLNKRIFAKLSLPRENAFRGGVSKRCAEVSDLVQASLNDEGELVCQREYQVGFVQGISHV